MATIIIFAILGLIIPTLGLSIDIKEEGEKLNKVEAAIIGLPVAIVAALAAAFGKPMIVVGILIVLGVLQLLHLFKKDRSIMFLFTSVLFGALLITLLVKTWTGLDYWMILYASAIVFPIMLAISKNTAANAIAAGEEEPGASTVILPLIITGAVAIVVLAIVYLNSADLFSTKSESTVSTAPVAEAIAVEETAPAVEEAAEAVAEPVDLSTEETETAEAEPINLSGQQQGASISTVEEDIEGNLTVDLNKVALYGNQYEGYSRIFSDFGEQCMPTQANWDKKNRDLRYAKEKGFVKETWQDAVCFMPEYTYNALTADGVKGLDTLAKYLDENHKEDMKEDVIKQIKCNPVYGLMWADGLSKIELTTGKTLGDINEWMTRTLARNEEFRAVLYGQHPRGNEGWLEAYIDEAGNRKIRTTDEYDEFATKMLILIFDCFSDELGIDRYQSKIMYGLEANMDGDLIQCERMEKGEDYPGYMLKYDRKDADREILLKINVFDLRLEICDRHQKSVKQIQQQQSSKPKANPVTPKKVTGVPINGVPVIPTPTPTPTPIVPPPPTPPYNKDPNQDPGNRGNAPDGSGQNDDKGPGTLQPTDPGYQPPKVDDGSDNNQPSQPDPAPQQDENKPDDTPTPVHEDSHDNGDSNSGENNGEFTM